MKEKIRVVIHESEPHQRDIACAANWKRFVMERLLNAGMPVRLHKGVMRVTTGTLEFSRDYSGRTFKFIWRPYQSRASQLFDSDTQKNGGK